MLKKLGKLPAWGRQRLAHCAASRSGGSGRAGLLGGERATAGPPPQPEFATKETAVASLVAQLVKSLRKTQVPPWVGKIP